MTFPDLKKQLGIEDTASIVTTAVMRSTAVSITAKLVYLAITNLAYEDTNDSETEQKTRASIAKIADYIGIVSRTAVIKAVRELETADLLRVTRKTGCYTEYALLDWTLAKLSEGK